MAEQQINQQLSDEEKLKQMAEQMRAAEYAGLSEEEIQKREQQKQMRKQKNIEILEDTLKILENGFYKKDEQTIRLVCSAEQMRTVNTYLPEDIELLRKETTDSTSFTEEQTEKTECSFGCENIDALVLAQRKYSELKENGETSPRVLVLNLASSTEPGGQSRKGASAQEEDLCRRTSLLLSLESEEAKKYYEYNKARKTRMGSDGIVISPYVEVIKDYDSQTLEKPLPVSVMSCAAPMVRLGLEGMSQQEYEDMLYKRIEGMLLVASSLNYRNLILGAFGCGVFGNDAAIVSDLFAKVINNFGYAGKNINQWFDSIEFAVLCRPEKDYNYKEFYRNFSKGNAF